MLREYRIKKKSLLGRAPIRKRKGVLGIAFGVLMFLLIVVGAVYSGSYAQKFGRGYVRLGKEYRPPEIGLFNKVFQHREDQSGSSPTGKDAGAIKKETSLNNWEDYQYQEDEFYRTGKDTEDLPDTSSVIYLLGTDKNGHDILAKLLAGCQVILFSGVMAVSLTLILGISFGIFSGYLSKEPLFDFFRRLFTKGRKAGGRKSSSIYLGDLVNLFPTIVNIFPRLVLIVIVLSLWEEIDIWSVVIAIGIINVPKLSYIIKDKIEHLKNQEFIEAARELGVPHSQIILKHILWYNCRPILLVQMAFIFAEVILVESSLSYLGHGLSDSWGGMVASESGLILYPSGIYWPFVFPAAAIVAAIVAFNALGDGLSRWFEIKS